MTVMEIIAQIFGILAMIASVLSFQPKSYNKIMWLQALCSALFCVNFGLLYLNGNDNALTASVIMLFLVIRDIIFIIIRKKEKSIVPAAIGCVIVIVALGIVSWSGYTSLLYIAGMTVGTISFAMKNPQRVRILMMICLPILFSYDIINVAVGACISDVLSMASTVTAYIRYRRKEIKEG